MVLEKINQVNDIKKIPPEEYEQLALAYLRTSRGNAPFSRVSKKDKDFLSVG